MGTRSKKKSNRSIAISFVRERGVRDAIYLPPDTHPTIVAIMRRVIRAWANYQYRSGWLEEQDRKDTKNLPQFCQDKLLEKGLATELLKGKVVVPTLRELIEADRERRSKNKNVESTRVWRIGIYLLEKFPADKRIDSFIDEDAETFRKYLNSERIGRDGKPIEPGSANYFIRELKTVFRFAVEKGWLSKSPFEHVKVGSVKPKRVPLVKDEVQQAAIDACQHPELKFLLAVNLHVGWRGESEFRDLRFSDFKSNPDDPVVFYIPETGKTGSRRVAFFPELKPYYDAVRSAALPEQEFVFAKFRTYSNVREAIRKELKRVGQKLWAKPFTSPRAACQTRMHRAGCSEDFMDAFFGNSEPVRRAHYIEPEPESLSDEEYAAAMCAKRLGQDSGGAAGAPDSAPALGGTDRELCERMWGMVGERFGLSLSGKELFDGFLASNEYVSAMNDLNTIASMTCDYSNKTISDRQFRLGLKKYFKRTGQDAADFVDECFERMEKNAPELGWVGLEPTT